MFWCWRFIIAFGWVRCCTCSLRVVIVIVSHRSLWDFNSLPFALSSLLGIVVSVVYISNFNSIRWCQARSAILTWSLINSIRVSILLIFIRRLIPFFFCAFHLDTVETRKNKNYVAERNWAAIRSVLSMYICMYIHASTYIHTYYIHAQSVWHRLIGYATI